MVIKIDNNLQDKIHSGDAKKSILQIKMARLSQFLFIKTEIA